VPCQGFGVLKQSIDAHGEWHLPFRVSRVADAIFWGDPENKGFAQAWQVRDGALEGFLLPRAFDEVRNGNRMCAGEPVCSPHIPRHVGPGGVRPEFTWAIDLPAFAGQRWGSPTRTSLRE